MRASAAARSFGDIWLRTDADSGTGDRRWWCGVGGVEWVLLRWEEAEEAAGISCRIRARDAEAIVSRRMLERVPRRVRMASPSPGAPGAVCGKSGKAAPTRLTL